MENNAIVGFTGFVGSNLLQFYKFNHFYNSKNFKDAKNKEFDTLFFCGVPAIKWKANKNPEEDNSVIEELKNVLNTITIKKIILISTIDVYDNTTDSLNEDYNIIPSKNHTYGKNRFLFEEYIKQRYTNYHIIRLPALFGKGLKKNMIYDLIHNNNVNNIPINSSFQWYYLDWLKKDIDIILHNNIKVCNLFTEPIDSINILQIFKKIYGIDYGFQIEYLGDDTSKIKYNTCTKYYNLFNNDKAYIRDHADIMTALEEYLQFEKIDKSRLCVSNICVNQISQLQFACLLKLYGISKVQIAPTKLINNWDSFTNINFDMFTSNDLVIYSLQSIVYGLDSLNIFDEKTQHDLFIHLTTIIDFAEDKGVKILVFGCPKNRKVLDAGKDNVATFVDFFQLVGDYCKDKNTIICLENNSKKYNCNFINTIDECANIVRKINKPNIKMMVDLGNAVMEKDHWYYLKQHMDIIYNIDISQENMEDFSNVHESNSVFKFVLDNNNYNKTINLEILIRDNSELDKLCASLNNFITIYN